MIWYYIDETITDGERRKGPYSIDEIRNFVKEGVIKDETLVWHSGMESWTTWKDTDEAKESSLTEEEQVRAALEAILAEHKSTKRYAGFFIRGIAYLVDNFILSVIGVLLLMILNAMQFLDLSALADAMNAYVNNPTSEDALSKVLDVPGTHLFLGIWGFIQAIYFICFTALRSATPGKKIVHIHVEAANGSDMNWILAALRYVASLFTQSTFMFYGLGYLIVMIDPKRRTLHDFIARTRVVHDKTRLETKDERRKKKE